MRKYINEGRRYIVLFSLFLFADMYMSKTTVLCARTPVAFGLSPEPPAPRYANIGYARVSR